LVAALPYHCLIKALKIVGDRAIKLEAVQVQNGKNYQDLKPPWEMKPQNPPVSRTQLMPWRGRRRKRKKSYV